MYLKQNKMHNMRSFPFIPIIFRDAQQQKLLENKNDKLFKKPLKQGKSKTDTYPRERKAR